MLLILIIINFAIRLSIKIVIAFFALISQIFILFLLEKFKFIFLKSQFICLH